MGDEVATPVEWTPRWCGGAPLPYVVADSLSTYLLYAVDVANPDWDGKSVRVVNPAALRKQQLGVAKFDSCYVHTFGGPNDEVFDGHRLAGRGLDGYGAYEVKNSRWIEEMMRVNSVHHGYNPQSWEGLNHYLLAFHDEMFECLARGWSVEVWNTTFDEALQRIAHQMVQR